MHQILCLHKKHWKIDYAERVWLAKGHPSSFSVRVRIWIWSSKSESSALISEPKIAVWTVHSVQFWTQFSKMQLMFPCLRLHNICFCQTPSSQNSAPQAASNCQADLTTAVIKSLFRPLPPQKDPKLNSVLPKIFFKMSNPLSSRWTLSLLYISNFKSIWGKNAYASFHGLFEFTISLLRAWSMPLGSPTPCQTRQDTIVDQILGIPYTE